MGSASSKAASTAKTASKLTPANTARKYPTRSPPPTSNRTNVQPGRAAVGENLGPSVHPETHTSATRDNAINLDASDPSLSHATRLRTLGPVQPNPTQSNSSTFNTHSHNTSQTQSQSSHSGNQLAGDPNNPTSQFSSQFQPSPSAPQQTIYPTSYTTNPNSPNSAGAKPNPAVSLLTARYRLAAEAEQEFEDTGRRGAEGRQFLDVGTLRQVLVMRGEGREDGEIERGLGLRRGVVGRLGRVGVVDVAGL